MKRLDAVLSACSVGSRSEAKALIRKGKVSVNGTVVRDVSFAVTDSDEVRVNGIVTDTSEFVYLMLNKPCGFVSTTDADEENVLSFVPSELFRKGMFPVGRLDKDTSGLIFLTNNGAFSHMLTSPSRHVEKEYIATLERPLDEICFEFFAEGMTLKDGFTTRPAKLERLGEKKARVVISEGKYHQVRRMFACCGNRVETLKRVRIGGVELDPTLEEGEVRKLTDEELDLLKT